MRYIQIINEAQNYEGMFNAMLNLDGVEPSSANRLMRILKLIIKHDIDFAKSNFKKNDRIIWYLKWQRLILLYDYLNDETKEMYTPLLKKYAAALGINHEKIEYYKTYFAYFNHDIKHFLSLPCPEIQNTVWLNQTPDELSKELREKENKWKESRNQLITYNYAEDEPTVFLKINSEWAWYDLNTKSCDAESKAMGHCGNGATPHRNDNILSLRKRKVQDDKIIHRPSLTFIENDGLLGEMKGRANEKPKEKYHNYIVALLKDPRIVGIIGGGYEPQHNFSVDDLSDEHIEALGNKHHQLRGPYGTYERYFDAKREGASEEELINIKTHYLKQMEAWFSSQKAPYDHWGSNPTIDLDKDLIILEEYEDYQSYMYSNNQGLCERVLDVLKGLSREMIIQLDIRIDRSRQILKTAERELKPEIFSSVMPYEYNFYGNTVGVEYYNGGFRVTQELDDFMESYLSEDTTSAYDENQGFTPVAGDDDHLDGVDELSNDPIVNKLVELAKITRNDTINRAKVTSELIEELYDRYHDSSKYGTTERDKRQYELNI